MMTKRFGLLLAATVLVLGAPGTAPDAAAPGEAPAPAAATPTFARDVAPILYKNCASCHRKGEIGPMALMTYEEVRPWARAIGTAVETGLMPPWHADAPRGTFENERYLSDADKDVIARWVAGGAPRGDLK